MVDEVERRSVEDLEEVQPATPGLQRRTAFSDEGHWFGHVVAEADTMSGWHHHGEHTTFGYILEGNIRLEFGPGGGESLDVGAGDFFVVPPHAVHREGNASPEDARAIVVRAGEGPPVFPADAPGTD